MSLACLVCHKVKSPSRSFGSYSVSSLDNEGSCSAIGKCLTGKGNHASIASTSELPTLSNNPRRDEMTTGSPRLVRSCAVRRDHVRDWNFEGQIVPRLVRSHAVRRDHARDWNFVEQ